MHANGPDGDPAARADLKAVLQENEKRLLEQVALGGPLEDLLAAILESYEPAFPGVRGSVLLLDEGGTRLLHLAGPRLPLSFCMAVNGIEIGPKAGSCGTAAFTKRAVIVKDIRTDPLWESYRHIAESHGLRACWSMPIFGTGARLLGTFAFYFDEPRDASEADLAVVSRGAHLASLAIERMQTERALRDSQEQLKAVFEQAAVGVAQIDSVTGQFLLVNNRYAEIAGYTREELTGMTFQAITHPEDLDADLENMRRLMNGQVREFSMEKRYIRKDGSIVWVNLTVSPGWTAGSQPRRHIAVVEDVTARRLMEEHLSRTQRLASLGTLAAGIAHDFNNLLTGIFGWLDLIRFRTGSPRVIECVDNALTAMDRARELTRHLLTFAEGGAPVLSALDLAGLLRETSQSVLAGSNVTAEMEMSAELPLAHADPIQIKQVLENLLTNAKQAMPAGGKIKLKTEALASGWIRATITDEGHGIAKEFLSRIFDPFFTTRPGGRGLGLAVAHSIVTRHGGRLEVFTDEGRGTSFFVELPPVSLPAERLKPGELGSRILAMDDEPAILMLLSDLLAIAGCHCLTTTDGKEAAAAYEEALHRGKPFDLVILDLTVPGGLGALETLPLLRSIDPHVRVLVTSGYAEDPVLRDPISHGFAGSLVKPWESASLMRALRQGMEKK